VGTHESAVLPVLEEIFRGCPRPTGWLSNGKVTAAEEGTADFINSESVLSQSLSLSSTDWTNAYLP
jgi:hypothetical protein